MYNTFVKGGAKMFSWETMFTVMFIVVWATRGQNKTGYYFCYIWTPCSLLWKVGHKPVFPNLLRLAAHYRREIYSMPHPVTNQ